MKWKSAVPRWLVPRRRRRIWYSCVDSVFSFKPLLAAFMYLRKKILSSALLSNVDEVADNEEVWSRRPHWANVTCPNTTYYIGKRFFSGPNISATVHCNPRVVRLEMRSSLRSGRAVITWEYHDDGIRLLVFSLLIMRTTVSYALRMQKRCAIGR